MSWKVLHLDTEFQSDIITQTQIIASDLLHLDTEFQSDIIHHRKNPGFSGFFWYIQK